ncbi:MAG: hypothetical protein HRT44_04005 [Bdellovibrionales bacterium]|nr:hypothetical protein [Bdellovibrionales bacterium]NQZ18406.1 hypothetical protein [Bdellovibrionales bacterium]
MLETQKITSIDNESGETLSPEFRHLREILTEYFSKHPQLTVNGLAKRCPLSEPTIRRIKKGQLKTLPSTTSILGLLSYLCKSEDLKAIVEAFPGPIADYLSTKTEQMESFKNLQYSEELSNSLKDPAKYVLYKLATAPQGVDMEKAVELFGIYGQRQMESLEAEDLLYKKEGSYFAKISSFSLSHDVFIEHFKTMADFIKPHKHAQAHRSYSPIFTNYSGTISKKAYSDILKIQRTAQKKIAKIISNDDDPGHIPTFYLSAIDTIDHLCADEFPDDQ